MLSLLCCTDFVGWKWPSSLRTENFGQLLYWSTEHQSFPWVCVSLSNMEPNTPPDPNTHCAEHIPFYSKNRLLPFTLCQAYECYSELHLPPWIRKLKKYYRSEAKWGLDLWNSYHMHFCTTIKPALLQYYGESLNSIWIIWKVNAFYFYVHLYKYFFIHHFV